MLRLIKILVTIVSSISNVLISKVLVRVTDCSFVSANHRPDTLFCEDNLKSLSAIDLQREISRKFPGVRIKTYCGYG